MQCCVPFCQTTAGIVSESAGITFHKFPSEVHLRAAWLRALGTQDSHLPDSAVVCSQHFLSDDMWAAESGSRQVRTGAIPSVVQVCMICLDAHSKLFLMNKYKLDEAYQHLVGQPPCDSGNLKQTLCIQCAHRLLNFNKFRDKSLRARALMMELVEKHELISMQHIDTFNEANNRLKHNIVKTILDPNHCDLYINADTDKRTDITATLESVPIKNEATVPMLVDEEITQQNVLVKHDTEKGFNINLVVTKEEYLSDEEPKQLTDPLLVQPSTSKQPVEEPLPQIKYEITFECSICLEEFLDEDTYNYHMSMHMEENQNQTEEPSAEFGHSTLVALLNANNRKQNVLSGSEYLEILHLTHQETIAPVAKKVSQKTKSKTNETNTDDDIYFTCKICNSKYKHKLCLQRHIRTHTYPYSCEFCEYKCMVKSNLVTHVRIHTGEKPFTCEICKLKFKRKCDLVKHMKTHTNDKPYACKICELKFRLKSGLKEHMKTHSGTRPYSCKLCEYKSIRNRDLVRHMKSHTGEKPFACELCDFKCIRKCNLAYHVTTHTGEKPFTCEICELKFSLKTNLRRHMMTHTGNKL